VAALQDILPLIISASLGCLLAAIGMNATLADMLHLWNRPKQLLKAILSVNLVVPLAAVGVVALFPITPAAKAGILLMSVSPVPPFVPLKALKVGGGGTYSVGLYAALAVLSIAIVPAAIAILRPLYDIPFSLPVSVVARNVLWTALLPLTAGILLRASFPSAARRMAGPLENVAMLALICAAMPVLIGAGPAIAALMGDGTIAAMAAVVIVALFVGHLLGGPDPRHRAALALASATRHPGLALMIVSANGADKAVSAAILCFLLVAAFVAAPYQHWCARRFGRASA
jgi:BASS family bile acid:Na+ symporter